MCIFHKWSKWTPYEKIIHFKPGIFAPKEYRNETFTETEYRQRKKCEKCGKIKDVLIYSE